MNKKKLSNPKLVKTTIINKLGHKQTVYIRPDDPRAGIVKKVEAGKKIKEINLKGIPVLRKKKQEAIIVTKKGDILPVKESYESLELKYKDSKPVTWKLMTQGKWKKGKNGEKIVQLTPSEWAKIVKENDKLIHFIAKKYAFGEVYGERYKELRSVGKAALVEAVNKYYKVFNKKQPFDFPKFAYVYIKGRIRESIANKLDAGLRIPKGLQQRYREYLEVKRKLQEKYGVRPKRELIAKELQKIWDKKKFYPQYATAEERIYGEIYIVKDKKGKVVYKGGDIKKAKAIFKKGFSFEKRNKTFQDLTLAEKKLEKEKDKLPLENWVSVTKEGVLKNKEEKHEENISKIEEEYRLRKEQLEATYYSTNEMNEQDKLRAKNIIGILQKRVDDNNAKIDELVSNKLKIIAEIESEVEKLEEKLKSYKTKTSKAYKDVAKKIAELKSNSYRDNAVKDINLQLKELREKSVKLEQDLNVAKQLFEPMTKDKFEERLQQLENEKQAKLAEETHRYNKDTSSTLIPGIIERIKEFEQIESIKEVPLNLEVETEDGDSRQNLEVVYRTDVLSEEEKQGLLQQHTLGKQVLKDALEMLVPVYKDIMALRMGLHKESAPTVDNLWGQLATVKDIQNYLDKKHKILLSNPDKFVELVSKIKNDADRYLMVRSLPYVNNRYFREPNLLVKDYQDWKNSKPTIGRERKVKLDAKKYKQLRIKWLKAKKEARMKWKQWRKRNPEANQEMSKKAYDKIKEKLKANNKYKPKKFIIVKEKKIDPKKLRIWENRKPKIFSESNSAKEAFILNAINESTEILRRIVPLKAVKSLLAAHRKLVESGVSVEKSMIILNNIHNYFSKSIFGLLL